MEKTLYLDTLFCEKAPGVYREDEFQLPTDDQFATGVPVFIGLVPKLAEIKHEEREPGKHRPKAPLTAYVEHCRRDRKQNLGARIRPLSVWSHFKLYVGDENCMLGYAVRGFFQNGGKRCYVVPLTGVPQEAVGEDLEKKMQDSLEKALDASEVFDVDLVCVPDLGGIVARDISPQTVNTLQQMVVTHCEKMGTRFAILDTTLGAKRDAVSQQWSDIDGRNGAIYYPWIKVRGIQQGIEVVPPCGHIAGIYARSDGQRGVHKAPANEVLEGVLDLEHAVTNYDQDFLNPRNVNCLRSFPGRGIRVWGARTLSAQEAWMYVNVRRIFLTAARWSERHMADVTFEPNGPALWARIERELNAYFASIHRLGALKGRTALEAFYVKCNSETNPKEICDLGQVVTEIGLSPTKPYEFVVVRLIHGAGGVSISGPIRPEQN
ncbi:MAG TPA: phage tail sheath subtilisin-like domain-containing protein [Candidatus Angelobacter sp.]|jgi:hypothetical protein|nr:phage tail sheath subtilisin-like domain-containing protein [Candidatus Angelobacter sp.]